MLNLSIKEQQQIAGGYYQVIVTRKNGAFVTVQKFGTYEAASNYAKGRVNAGLNADIARI